MRVFLRIAFCACLVAATTMAQRGGGSGGFRGGGGGGGFHGGGGMGGFHGGGAVGGFGGGGGWGYSGFRGGLGYGFRGYGGFYGGFYGSYWPMWDFGYPYGPGYYDYGYVPYAYPYPYSYDPSPNTTVIYPAPAQTAPSTVYVEHANPVVHEYDQYGQEIKSSSRGGESTIYLLAFTDRVVRATEAYWVDGKTLHYITLDHEPKQAPLDTVDRDLSLRLNRERRVAFSLPAP